LRLRSQLLSGEKAGAPLEVVRRLLAVQGALLYLGLSQR
jgi:hypothetical protein